MRGLVRAGELNAIRRAPRPRHAMGALALGLVTAFPIFAGCSSGVPPGGAAAVYRQHCAGCHGDSGRGDGLQARLTFLKVPSFADPARMAQLTDDYLYTVIAKGSAALGGTSAMPGWDHILTPEQIRALVAYIRAFAASPPPPR
jgi:high-affinity iron transporter